MIDVNLYSVYTCVKVLFACFWLFGWGVVVRGRGESEGFAEGIDTPARLREARAVGNDGGAPSSLQLAENLEVTGPSAIEDGQESYGGRKEFHEFLIKSN